MLQETLGSYRPCLETVINAVILAYDVHKSFQKKETDIGALGFDDTYNSVDCSGLMFLLTIMEVDPWPV